MTLRAVIYARYSSENQQEASIDDQIRGCRRLIDEKGWHLQQIYCDRAISGATALRPDYQRLLAQARQDAFDIVVAEGIDRLSRDQETIASLFKQLSFLGKTIVTRAEGLVNELHVGLKGTMNALFLKDLAIKTHRGIEGRVRQGRSGGGRAFGYRTIVDQSQDQRGVRAIEPVEANVVRRIFQYFAAGCSPRAIAKTLNADGIVGPTGKAWRDTTIRGHALRRTGILRNDLYVGRLVWNKQTYIRDPETGKRVARVRALSDRIVADVPALRIISQELWDAVQARLDNISSSPRAEKIRSSQFWKFRRPKHLLTGLIVCGACTGLMEAVGKDYLACRAARSGAGCHNRKGIRRTRVEQVVLEALKTQLMAPDLLKVFIEGFHEELNRKSAADDQRRHGSEQELDKVTRKLKGLYQAIADGLRSPGLQKELLALEGRQSELEQTIAVTPPPAPRLHPRLGDLYRQRVTHLHVALNDLDARTEAAAILRTLVESIAVLPGQTDGHQLVLTGDIVNMLSLPGEQVPSSFQSSVKVVAGTRNCHYLLFNVTGLGLARSGSGPSMAVP